MPSWGSSRDALRARRGVWTAGEGSRHRRTGAGRRRPGFDDDDEDDDPDENQISRDAEASSAVESKASKRNRKGRFVPIQNNKRRGPGLDARNEETDGSARAAAEPRGAGAGDALANRRAPGPSANGDALRSAGRASETDAPPSSSRVASSLEASSSDRVGEDAGRGPRASRRSADAPRAGLCTRAAAGDGCTAPELRGTAAELLSDLLTLERSLQDSRSHEEEILRKAHEETAAVHRTLEHVRREEARKTGAATTRADLSRSPRDSRAGSPLPLEAGAATLSPRLSPDALPLCAAAAPRCDGPPDAADPGAPLPRSASPNSAVPEPPSLPPGEVVDLLDSDSDDDDAGAKSGPGAASSPRRTRSASRAPGRSGADAKDAGPATASNAAAPTAPAASAPPSPEDARVLLRLRCQHGSKLLLVRRRAPLRAAFARFVQEAAAEGWVCDDAEVSDAAFEWDGENIDESATPDALGVEDEDIVDVFFR